MVRSPSQGANPSWRSDCKHRRMQTYKRPTDAVRAELKILTGELATLRDDIKVQARLGTMELRDRWNGIEKRHADLHQSLRDAGNEVIDSARSSFAELRSDVTRLRKDAGIDPDPEC